MISTRCQICGRRKPLRLDGAIVKHHRQGDECRGSGRAPEGRSTLAIEQELVRIAALDARMTAEYRAYRDRRANEPMSAGFYEQWLAVSKEQARLMRRRARLSR